MSPLNHYRSAGGRGRGRPASRRRTIPVTVFLWPEHDVGLLVDRPVFRCRFSRYSH